MRFLELFQKEIISLVFALILAAMLYLFRARAKLLWATPHGFTFLLQTAGVTAAQNPSATQATTQLPAGIPQNFNIYTGSIVVFNAGRVPATEVEVTFNWRPENYNIWPVRPHDTHLSPDNRYTLKFANLAPHEQFQIELISPIQLPNVMSVRCKECVGRQIGMRPMVIYPNWLITLFWVSALFGMAAVIYLLIKLGALVV